MINKERNIISVSKRTDIPAFYSEWFHNRVEEGYALYRNPFNLNQEIRVSLDPEHVIAFVFWTRNPEPLIKYLPSLEKRGYKFYFHFTINNYPQNIDKSTPNIGKTIDTFKKLSELYGKELVQWRYDPILFSNHMTTNWHIDNFELLNEKLSGYTERCYFSFIDYYLKTKKRLKELENNSEIKFYEENEQNESIYKIVPILDEIGFNNNIKLYSCNERIVEILIKDNILKNTTKAHCIDIDIIKRISANNNLFANIEKCGCFYSKDIGAYDSCMYKCLYCYANVNFEKRSKDRLINHDPKSALLIDERKLDTHTNDDRFKKDQLELF